MFAFRLQGGSPQRGRLLSLHLARDDPQLRRLQRLLPRPNAGLLHRLLLRALRGFSSGRGGDQYRFRRLGSGLLHGFGGETGLGTPRNQEE